MNREVNIKEFMDLPTLLNSDNFSDQGLSYTNTRKSGNRHERNSQINNEEDLKIIFEKIANVQKVAE